MNDIEPSAAVLPPAVLLDYDFGDLPASAARYLVQEVAEATERVTDPAVVEVDGWEFGATDGRIHLCGPDEAEMWRLVRPIVQAGWFWPTSVVIRGVAEVRRTLILSTPADNARRRDGGPPRG
ncbi:hypothetical protein J2S58_002126 [Nakamurella flavida]|uniref:hypothetical protein n=1 Tax=Nakamurella flavida TaxID=363630 RepID=UPI00277D8D4A|nr:hypothetical protein [Nakamurella flavida]MDP9778503.1 hypothetical protein [Nakamurella flavida]